MNYWIIRDFAIHQSLDQQPFTDNRVLLLKKAPIKMHSGHRWVPESEKVAPLTLFELAAAVAKWGLVWNSCLSTPPRSGAAESILYPRAGWPRPGLLGLSAILVLVRLPSVLCFC